MSGLIFLGGDVYGRDETLYNDLLRSDFPMVGIECYMPGSVVVASDQEGCGRVAARHLLGLGHQRIGFVCEHDDGAAMGMQTGWKKALHQAGLEPEPWWEVRAAEATLASAKPALISQDGDAAKVGITYTFLGKQITSETDMVKVDGRWYGKESLDSIFDSLAGGDDSAMGDEADEEEAELAD